MSTENILRTDEPSFAKTVTLLSDPDDRSREEPNSIIFRITGPQSISRLQPLIYQLCVENNSDSRMWTPSTESSQKLSFVWETTCEKLWRDRHVRYLSDCDRLQAKCHNVNIKLFF